jgi:predicted acylesterase/phospholipase RssA
MLGRLRMTVQECIKTFYSIAEKAFSVSLLSKAWGLVTEGARYDEKILEKAIKAVIKEKLGDENAPMRSAGNECKVYLCLHLIFIQELTTSSFFIVVSFVVACRTDDLNNQIATHLRTYYNLQIPDNLSDCTIWQAARATCAAPTYFRRMKIGDCEYVDGGLGFNNPTLL